jgi:trans-2,3-dihydro-3-hydroxyanthranilate isomerase
MQKLANEISYSETTFISVRNDGNADFDMRIFTATCELPFAGHPTLGTAFCIMELLGVWRERRGLLKLNTKVGVIPLRRENRAIWMTQNTPEFFVQYTNKGEVAELVGLAVSDISDELPIEEVSTGNTMLIIPVKTLDAMQRAEAHVNKIKRFFTHRGGGPYLFSLETAASTSHVHTRFFAPHLGIMEDPATESAAGPLAGYLLKYGVFGESFTIVNEQGMEMGRPSTILMRGKREYDTYTVEIGGMCVYVGKGSFEIHERT